MKLSLHIKGTREELQRVLASLGGETISSSAGPRTRVGASGKKIFTAVDGFHRAHYKWRRNENAYLRKAYMTSSLETLAKTLGRTPKSVFEHMNALGLRGKFELVQKSGQLAPVILKMRGKIPPGGRIISSPRRRRTNGKGRAWAYAEDQQVRGMYGRVSTEEIAKRVNRSKKAVYLRARVLGLAKPWRKNETRQDVVAGQGSVQ
jgi:hypothetical protein